MDDKKVIDVIDAEIARRCILIRFSNRHGKLWGKRLRRIRIASAHQTLPDRHPDTEHSPFVMPLLFVVVVVVGRCASHLPVIYDLRDGLVVVAGLSTLP